MAFTAIAAIAGGAEVTAGLALAAVSEVGIAMTVVGAVTGNKDLMKIGGVMGLVGGIGGLVAGAGADVAAGAAASDMGSLGSMGSTAGDASAMDAAAASDAGSLGAPISQSAPVEATSPSIVNSAAQSAPIAQPAPVTDQAQSVLPQAPAAQQAQQAAQGAQADPLAVKGAVAPTGAQAPVTPADYNVGGRFGPDNMDVGGGFNPATAGAPANSSSFFSGWGSFVKDNQKLLAGGLQLVGGAMNGANQRDMFNQQLALNQQRLAQTSYGSQVANTTPRPGIVSGATA